MKSAFLHRTGGEIRQWMRDENDTDMSHLHASMWEQLRNKQHVKAVCGKRGGEEISGTHPICTPAEKEQ